MKKGSVKFVGFSLIPNSRNLPFRKEAIMRNLNFGKWQLLRSKIVGILISFVLILTTLIAFVPNIQAQRDRDRDRDDRPRYEHHDRDYARREYGRGQRDGFERGREDARERRRFDPGDSRRFREGSRPYREGFMDGYRDGYRSHQHHRRF